MKEIKASKGEIILVSDEDFDYLSQFRWYLNIDGYPVKMKRGENKHTFMHRMVMKTPDGMYTDHINKNKLDNQRENLRICTKQQNNANRAMKNTSGFRGVCLKKNTDYWIAQISLGGSSTKHLGSFKKIEDAARAYDKAARERFGEFAVLNFPEKDTQ